MIRSARNVLVAVALLAALLGAGSPALAVGSERGNAHPSAHLLAGLVRLTPSTPAERSPAGSEKSRVTSPGGIDGVALDLGYVEEPESPIPPVLHVVAISADQAIAVAIVLLAGGIVLLLGGATFMIVTLARVSRRERNVERILVRRDSNRDA